MPLDPTLHTFERAALPLAQLAPSPFNKRAINRADPALATLAASLATQQVQAITVRPLTESTTQRPGDYESGARYQIVAGHRRVAAAQLAGLATLDAVIRPMTDDEVRLAHLTENLQREGLAALEEAAAYAELRDRDGASCAQIAAAVGKSKSHVAIRLKLLDACPEVRAALEAGEIGAEVAGYIARLPLAKFQIQALGRARDRGVADGGRNSTRRVHEDLIEHFSTKLADAIFDTQDAALLPNAGACTACPKRSGGDPDLFADIVTPAGERWYGPKGEDICTDTGCFAEKKKAHLAAAAAALAAQGKAVVAGNAARSALSATGEVKGGYVALKDVKAELAKAKAKDKVTVVEIQDQRTGKLVKAVKREDAKAAGVKLESAERAGPQRSWEEQNRRREEADKRKRAEAELETEWRRHLLTTLRAQYAGAERSATDLQLVAEHALDNLGYRARAGLLWLYSWKDVPAARKLIATLTRDELALLLLDIALVDDVRVDMFQPRPAQRLAIAANAYGVDVKALRAQWQASQAPKVTEIHSGDQVKLKDGSTHEVLRKLVNAGGDLVVVVWAGKGEQQVKVTDVVAVLPKASTPKKKAAPPAKSAKGTARAAKKAGA